MTRLTDTVASDDKVFVVMAKGKNETLKIYIDPRPEGLKMKPSDFVTAAARMIQHVSRISKMPLDKAAELLILELVADEVEPTVQEISKEK